jgi:peptidyl-prolyl cis-trans isomerase C
MANETIGEKSQSQNLITAASIIIAFIAILYAVLGHSGPVEKHAKSVLPSFEKGENNPVVLTLNGKEVTRMEVLDNFSKSNSQLPEGANLQQLFPLMQQQYVIGEVLTQAAMDRGIDESNPNVAMQMLQAKRTALRAAFIELVGEEGVPQEEIQKAYDNIIANAQDITERRARHILVKDRETAEKLIEQAKQTDDFASLATENSTGPSAANGGDLGYFSEGEMVKEFSDAAFAGEIGQVVPRPIKTQFGYHVIKVEDERVRPKPTLEQVKPQIMAQLRQAVVAEKIQELTADADVKYMDMSGNPIATPETATDAEVTAEEEPTETQ